MLKSTLYNFSLICSFSVRFSQSFSSSHQTLQELFTTPRIHNLLRLITFVDEDAVHQPTYQTSQSSSIKLLSDAELKTIKDFSAIFTTQRLQLPPVLMPKQDNDKQVISIDSNLRGLLPANNRLVFTDITLNKTKRSRLIVVREPDGTLRHANSSERNRLNQVYFPLRGRSLHIPLMFEDRHLEPLLDQGSYLYVLDRVCVQFEPDDPEFIRLSHKVYDHINGAPWYGPTNPLKHLRHTRHYGPMALYLIAQIGAPGRLVFEALSSQNFPRLGWLLRLIYLIRPNCGFSIALNRSDMDLPPPSELDMNNQHSNEFRNEMNKYNIDYLLNYVEMFIEHEPIGPDKKDLLSNALQQARTVGSVNADKRVVV